MDVDAEAVINNLGDQIKQMSKALAVKDAQIEALVAEISKLNDDG